MPMQSTTAPQAGSAAPLLVVPLRRFRLEVECDGAPFRWEGDATSESAAFRCAAHDLAVNLPMIEDHQVRVVSCVEVTA